MKKYLLPEKGNFYKANLHSHSTVSDGRLTPAQMKEFYMAQGYSIIAYTDHEVLVPHPELADENFLPLNGYEMSIPDNSDKPWRYKKTAHIGLVALDPDNIKHVCKHRTSWPGPNGPMSVYRDQMQFLYEDEPDFIRDHTPACINEVIRRGRENGFFVTYNHPDWSLDNYSDYTQYHGMHAMEICNYASIVEGYNDYNEKEYDDILRSGERIFCVGGDDNHNKPDRPCDSFGAFTVIKAEKLEYKAVADALLAGHFYASQGPEINELWYENGKIHICCSDADRIILHTDSRRAQIVFRTEDAPVNSATFDVVPEDVYVRITVIDANGKHANTNAYFTDQLF